MPAFLKKKKQGKVHRRSAFSPSLWLFYLGLLSMSLTGVTFSRYVTVVHGTISVQVADSYQVIFLDDGATVASYRIYEGQQLHDADIPEGNGSDDMESLILDADSIEDAGAETIEYRIFLGWSLDGETIVDPAEIEVSGDLCFHAVYEVVKKTIATATPSNAAAAETLPQAPNSNQSAAAPPPAIPEPPLAPAEGATGAAGSGELPNLEGTGSVETAEGSPAGNNGNAQGNENENTVENETETEVEPVPTATSSNAAAME